MKKCYIRAIVLVVLFTGVFLLYPRITHKNGDMDVIVPISTSTIIVNGKIFNIDIADIESERTQGLSGKEILLENEGLLFIFDNLGVYPFWMKDMNFPIDIIWIGKDLNVVYIKENATPESFPGIFNPEVEALYVLEINAEEAEKNKIEIGDFLILNLADMKQ